MESLNLSPADEHRIEQKAEDCKRQRIELSHMGLFAFMQVYLAGYMTSEPGDWVRQLCARLDRVIQPMGRLVGVVPRYHAKTTIGTIAQCIRCICHGRKKHILLVAANRQESERSVRNIVLELEENKLLRADYGDAILPAKDEKGQYIANKDREVLFGNGVRLLAVPMNARIRGQIVRQHRPDYIILDDPEAEADINSPTVRERLWEWMRAALWQTLDNSTGSISWLGNTVHYDCLILRALELPGWERFRAKAITIRWEGKLLWPEHWTKDKLRTIEAEIGSAKFSQEFMNEPVSPDEQIFKPEYWQYYDRRGLVERAGRYYIKNPVDPGTDLLPLDIYAGFDPAMGLDKQHDESAWMVVGVQRKTNFIFVLEVGSGRMTFNSQLDRLKNIYAQWRPYKIAIESVAYQAMLGQQAWGAGMPVVPLKPIDAKKTRIEAASLKVEQGHVFLPMRESATVRFTDQAEMYPRAAHDDMLDAYTLCMEVLGYTTGRVFTSDRKLVMAGSLGKF